MAEGEFMDELTKLNFKWNKIYAQRALLQEEYNRVKQSYTDKLKHMDKQITSLEKNILFLKTKELKQNPHYVETIYDLLHKED